MNDNFETLPKTPISEEQFNEIIEQISETVDSVDTICKEMGISNRSFYQYKKKIGEQAEQKYARAKAAQADNLINKINQLHKDMHEAIAIEEDAKKCNAIVQAYKCEIDNYKWLASKLIPKTYGDKLDLTTNGNDITREIVITPIANTTKTTTQSQPTQDQQ
jgi:uncharacterized protein involved in tolerance to divalent cations